VPDEAPLVDGGAGLVPQGDGWFVVNAADAGWMAHDTFGARCNFEADGRLVNGRPELHVQQHLQLGIRLQVLEPGKPGAMYHRESNQEDFLVLSGECLLIVEGEERHLSCVGSRALSSRHDACLRGRGRRPVRDPHGRSAHGGRHDPLPARRGGAPPRHRR